MFFGASFDGSHNICVELGRVPIRIESNWSLAVGYVVP